MIKSLRKEYMAPWSSRRETAGLMGTFLLFLMGYSGHTELLISQTQHLFQQLIQMALVFLGLIAPVSPSPSTRFHQAPMKAPPLSAFTMSSAPRPAASGVAYELMFIPMKSIPHHREYIFEGNATFHGKPCPNASILVRLITGDQTLTQGTITGPDGSYRVQASIDAGEKDPVDWTIEAYTSDFDKVEISGRRIIEAQGIQDDPDKKPIVVNNPIEFIISLAK